MKKRGKPKSKMRKGQRQSLPQSHAPARPHAGGDRWGLDLRRAQITAHQNRAPAVAIAPAYEADERQALALLLLPFLMIALSLGLSQNLKPFVGRLIEASRPLPAVVEPARPAGSIALAPIALPVAVPAALRTPYVVVATPPLQMPRVAPSIAVAPATPEVVEVIVPAMPIVVPLTPPAIPPVAVAAIAVPTPPVALPLLPPEVSVDAPVAPIDNAVCLPAAKRVALASPPVAAEFGQKLAQAAQAQTADFVIYSATYKRIAFPMGDVPSLYGACSDLVIRAYRALGIDLQDLVQRARVGRGDPNIDHRRTDTLRLFFTRYGESLPPSAFGEDYRPGDIVTYYRPYSRVSRAHIAIVSEVIGPSGRPMIVHNRGWGPQLEDALFVDQITGHYRFTGAPQLSVANGRMASEPDRQAKPRLANSALAGVDGALPNGRHGRVR